MHHLLHYGCHCSQDSGWLLYTAVKACLSLSDKCGVRASMWSKMPTAFVEPDSPP